MRRRAGRRRGARLDDFEAVGLDIGWAGGVAVVKAQVKDVVEGKVDRGVDVVGVATLVWDRVWSGWWLEITGDRLLVEEETIGLRNSRTWREEEKIEDRLLTQEEVEVRLSVRELVVLPEDEGYGREIGRPGDVLLLVVLPFRETRDRGAICRRIGELVFGRDYW